MHSLSSLFDEHQFQGNATQPKLYDSKSVISNWVSMSCQPHRTAYTVTSRKDIQNSLCLSPNSIHISKLLEHPITVSNDQIQSSLLSIIHAINFFHQL